MHKCLAYTPYYIQHYSEYSEYEPGQKLKNWLRNWFYWNQQPQIIHDSLVPNLNTKYVLCYLMLSKLAKWACTQWKLFFCLKTDFLSFFTYDLCYIFWFSRSVSNMLSNSFNWVKWVKWVIQGQELNTSIWNLFLWSQCPQIWVRNRNSYFYHQMLFLGVILLSRPTLSKMSNYTVETSKFCLEPHLIGFSTRELG